MTITDRNTVLILGAGVSAPFGIPLGGDLIDMIAKAIDRETQIIKTAERSDHFGHAKQRLYISSAQELNHFAELPLHRAIARKNLSPNQSEFDVDSLNHDFKALRQLKDLLRNQTSETIDDFIVENPSFAELTKISIASLLLTKCYQYTETQGYKTWSPRAFDSRRLGSKDERNWIHLLINIVRHGIRKGDVTPENKIKIITFNYDRILEFVLTRQFSNTESKYADFTNYIDVLHVHGCFDEIATNNLDFPAMALNWARGIHVVNEPSVPESILETRELARNIVAQSREIYCAGFSFAGPNCRLLGLDDLKVASGRRHLYFCNYDGNVGVKRSAEKLGRMAPKYIIVEEAPGTIERPLSISDWLKAGHLGDLPG